jgi:HSP20 family protein
LQAHQQTLQRASHWEPTYIPRTDIVEQDQHYEIVMELPGVAPESIDLKIEKNELRLTAAKRAPESGDGNGNANGDRKYLLRERRTGSYARVFRLGEVVDKDGIDARMVDGVLHVRIPKAANALPRKIAIA